MKHVITTTTALGCIVASTIMFSGATTAGDVPSAHVASPDVYKVLNETDKLRVVLATWKPGQKDNMHSHPILAAVSLTDCHFRITKANGKSVEKKPKALKGARIKGPIKAHQFQNIGKTTCQTLIVERID